MDVPHSTQYPQVGRSSPEPSTGLVGLAACCARDWLRAPTSAAPMLGRQTFSKCRAQPDGESGLAELSRLDV